jgi:hypothetical protein
MGRFYGVLIVLQWKCSKNNFQAEDQHRRQKSFCMQHRKSEDRLRGMEDRVEGSKVHWSLRRRQTAWDTGNFKRSENFPVLLRDNNP